MINESEDAAVAARLKEKVYAIKSVNENCDTEVRNLIKCPCITLPLAKCSKQCSSVVKQQQTTSGKTLSYLRDWDI